jgi:ATP-dependent Clp protease adaptor protein ClpS
MSTTVLPDTSTTTRLMPMFKVLIHNDDINDMRHVCQALMEVFKFELKKSVQIMVEAHKTGLALCTVEPKETAELHQEQLQSLNLTATIEPEN